LSEPTTHAQREAFRLSREALCFLALPLSAFAALSWWVAVRPLPFTGSVPWVPALGVSLAWRIDGLSALLLLLITGIGAAVFVYAAGYLHGHTQLRRLYVLLTLFMLSMIGCVLADDLVLLFVCWELTGLTSFLLVGFDHENAAARKAARQAFLVTGSGGLALRAGVILIGDAAGTWSISQLIERTPQLPVTPALASGVGLLMLGCFTKSAQFPFHFWLPDAMAAPTPVSAYLHSATMVKLGVYLLARLHPAFGSWPAWEVTLSLAGAVTAVWAMVLVLRERDLRRILAWSTVAALGTLVMLIGLPGNGPAVAVGAFLLAHALYKAPLFFVAGNVDHGGGTLIIDRLGGLRPKMPYTAAGAVMAAISMAGLPFSFGYIAKGVIAERTGSSKGGGPITCARSGDHPDARALPAGGRVATPEGRVEYVATVEAPGIEPVPGSTQLPTSSRSASRDEPTPPCGTRRRVQSARFPATGRDACPAARTRRRGRRRAGGARSARSSDRGTRCASGGSAHARRPRRRAPRRSARARSACARRWRSWCRSRGRSRTPCAAARRPHAPCGALAA
jgi:formate hydrogenlyase subunit 3/multisubunit Na+/H+ antiporter MnhD subunit